MTAGPRRCAACRTMLLAVAFAAAFAAATSPVGARSTSDIVGGGGFSDAAALPTGDVRDVITVNEQAFYSVSPDPGQARRIDVTVASADDAVRRVRAVVLDDARQVVDGPATASTDLPTRPAQLHAEYPRRGGAPGRGYLVVSVVGVDPTDDDATATVRIASEPVPGDKTPHDAFDAELLADDRPPPPAPAGRPAAVGGDVPSRRGTSLPIVLGLLAGAIVGALRSWYTAPPA